MRRSVKGSAVPHSRKLVLVALLALLALMLVPGLAFADATDLKKAIAGDQDFLSTILPIRDGVMVALRLR